MTVLSGDVLRPAPWPIMLQRHWRAADLAAVAATVAEAAGLKGLLLPYTRVAGRPAFPHVQVNEEIAAERLHRRQGPILDRADLRDHAASGFADAPPEAVTLSGFVVVEHFTVARQHLVGLGAWAPTVAAVPTWRPLDQFSTTECDVHGHRVYVSDGMTASPLPTGDEAEVAQMSRRDAWTRLRDEQMFHLALESGLVPC